MARKLKKTIPSVTTSTTTTSNTIYGIGSTTSIGIPLTLTTPSTTPWMATSVVSSNGLYVNGQNVILEEEFNKLLDYVKYIETYLNISNEYIFQEVMEGSDSQTVSESDWLVTEN